MAEGYYLKHGNQEFGPMDSNKLRQLAAQKKINPTDLIRRGTEGKWTSVSNVKGLFPEQPNTVSGKPTAIPATPIITSTQPTQVSVPPLSSSMSFENLGNQSADDSHRTAKHGPKRSKKKEPMNQKMILISSILGGVVLLLIVVIALVFIFTSKKKATNSAQKPDAVQSAENPTNSTETQPHADGENPKAAPGKENAQQSSDGENTDGSVSADSVDKTDAENTNDEEKNATVPKNALDSTEVGKAGDLEVKIASVRRGVQDTIQKDGTEDISDDKSTIITLSVKNINEEKTVKFTPWSIGLSKGIKNATLTDNNGNDYPFALKPGEIANGVKKESSTLYSDDPAVTDILVFKRYVPAAKNLYLTLTVPGNPKETIVFKIDVTNISKEDNAKSDAQPADENADSEKADEKNNATGKKADEQPTEDNVPDTNETTDNQADNTNDVDYNELNGVSEEAAKRDQEQADKELKDLNLGDDE